MVVSEEEALDLARKRVRNSDLEEGFGVPIVSGDCATDLTLKYLSQRMSTSVSYRKRKD